MFISSFSGKHECYLDLVTFLEPWPFFLKIVHADIYGDLRILYDSRPGYLHTTKLFSGKE